MALNALVGCWGTMQSAYVAAICRASSVGVTVGGRQRDVRVVPVGRHRISGRIAPVSSFGFQLPSTLPFKHFRPFLPVRHPRLVVDEPVVIRRVQIPERGPRVARFVALSASGRSQRWPKVTPLFSSHFAMDGIGRNRDGPCRNGGKYSRLAPFHSAPRNTESHCNKTL